MTAADPGQVQHLVQQRLHVPAAGQDALDVRALLGGQRLEFQQLGETEHCVERRAQFVAETADEISRRVTLALEQFALPGGDRVAGDDDRRATGSRRTINVYGEARPCRSAIVVSRGSVVLCQRGTYLGLDPVGSTATAAS